MRGQLTPAHDATVLKLSFSVSCATGRTIFNVTCRSDYQTKIARMSPTAVPEAPHLPHAAFCGVRLTRSNVVVRLPEHSGCVC
jgi:hypothetical protein